MYVLKEENSKELEEEGDQEDLKHKMLKCIIGMEIIIKYII